MAKAPKSRATARTASKKAKPADDLTVSLDEFAALCGVTPETMRSHLKTSPPDAEWMRVRGRPGVGYQIEAKGALAWYRSRGTGTGAGTDEIRQQRLAELRAQMLGDGDGGDDEGLILTGKQRYDEFRAGRAALDYLAEIKVLVRADEMEDATVNGSSSCVASSRRSARASARSSTCRVRRRPPSRRRSRSRWRCS